MDDTQRELEQRALRNVRGLVDKVEDKDQADRNAERRMIRNLVIGAVVAIAGFAALFAYMSNRQAANSVTIEQKR